MTSLAASFKRTGSTKVKPAAAVLIRLNQNKILVGQRSLSARSFPGFLAFPGGAVEADDQTTPLRSSQLKSYTLTEHAERACALRELGEETGYWFVVRENGDPLDVSLWEQFSAQVRSGICISTVLRDLGCVFDDARLVPLGEWVTPSFMPRRYQVRQFLLEITELPLECAKTCDELEEIGFRDVTQLLSQWHDGDALLLPPILSCLETLSHHLDEEALSEATVGKLKELPVTTPSLREIIKGIFVQPLRTPTLPPATHTNTLILGCADYLIVDPATPYADEKKKLDEMIEWLAAIRRRPTAIVLTHHHHDHIGDVERLHEQYQIPIWAHEETARMVPFGVHRHLHDGDELVCDGRPERRFQVLHTPGHAPGHICLWEKTLRFLVAGDMVASTGSILIDPADGHMGTYLASLQKLINLAPRRLVASHGPLLADGLGKLESQLKHRQKRQEAVLQALIQAGTWLAIDELVPHIYGGEIPSQMFPLAARSLESNLRLLGEQGVAEHKDGKYMARSK